MGKHYDALPNNFERAVVLTAAMTYARKEIDDGVRQEHELREAVEQHKETYADKSLGLFDQLIKNMELLEESKAIERMLNLAPGGKTR